MMRIPFQIQFSLFQLKRIRILFYPILFLCSVFLPLSVQGTWLHLRSEMTAEWIIKPAPEDSLKVYIRPRKIPPSEKLKKIIVLFTKKSSAYNTGLSKILSVFYDKKIYAEFTVINFKGITHLGQQALDFIEQNAFDLIYAMGSRSTVFLHKNYRNRPIPVVTVCSKDPVLRGQMENYIQGSHTNIAYTSLDIQIEVQMIFLKKLKPQLKNIAILYVRVNRSAYETQVKPMLETAQLYQVNVVEVVVEKQNNAKEELSVLIPKALQTMSQSDPDLKNSIFWITGSTSVFQEIETINRYSQNVPVLSVVPDVVSEGSNSAVLSIGVSFESNAHLAAIYGIDILRKKRKAGELTVGVVYPPDIAINFKRAREIQLKMPFQFFEIASMIYDHQGYLVRKNGKKYKIQHYHR